MSCVLSFVTHPPRYTFDSSRVTDVRNGRMYETIAASLASTSVPEEPYGYFEITLENEESPRTIVAMEIHSNGHAIVFTTPVDREDTDGDRYCFLLTLPDDSKEWVQGHFVIKAHESDDSTFYDAADDVEIFFHLVMGPKGPRYP